MSKHEEEIQKELLDDELVPRVYFKESLDNYVVVDGLPIITPEKKEKLIEVIRNNYSQVGKVKSIEVPFENETNLSKGYVFIEYETYEQARNALKLNNKQFGKSNVMKVNLWGDFEKYEKVPDTLEETPLQDIEITDPYGYVDSLGNDQFLIYQENTGYIYRNGSSGEKPTLVYSKENWAERFFGWSPQGTYLVSCSHHGATVWAGSNFEKVMEFKQNHIGWIEFSPDETYLITISDQKIGANGEIVVWDIVSGLKLKSFPVGTPLKWSHDDKYVARLNKGLVTIYEAPEMTILDKKSIKLNNSIEDFAWSPTENYLSVFVPEKDSIPARIVIFQIPERKEISQKNLFNVESCKMHWQSQGDYLAVKIDIKMKKTSYTSFEFFRMREKDIPVESISFQDNILAFAWEPKGHRFALIHHDESNKLRPNVSFYSLKDQKIKLLATLEKRQADSLFWSPAGNSIVIAGLRNLNGKLEFYNVDENESYVKEASHPLATFVDWDPTGRYVTTYVSAYNQQVENGFIIWSFIGKKLFEDMRPKLFQFLWRPLPKIELTEEEEKSLSQDWSKIADMYKKEDEEKRRRQAEERKKLKIKQKKDFEELMEKRLKEYKEQAPRRKELRGGIESDNEDDYVLKEEVIETVIEEYEEVV